MMAASNGHSPEEAPSSLNWMAALGARLIDNGWPILPIMPASKAPGSWSRGEWRPMAGWTKHCARPTTLIEAGIWASWPQPGIGIAGGDPVGIDIDIVDDRALAARIEELARAELGDTTLTRVGMWPKRLLVYRATEPFAGIKEFYPIEILARGQQFVAYGLHSETGQPYQWIDDTPADFHLMDALPVSETQCRAFLVKAYGLIPDSLKTRKLTALPDGSRHFSAGRPHGTIEAVTSALEWLSNDERDYNDWIRFGLALYAALGEAGADLWTTWSAKARKNDSAYTDRTWRGFSKRPIHSIGVGTIYQEAGNEGWTPQSDVTLDGDAIKIEPGDHPAQALIASIPAPVHAAGGTAADQNIFVPAAFRQENLTGFLAAFVEHTLASAAYPQPILAVAAGLSLVGTLAGRIYRSPTNLRTNLYIASIAESGGGKDHGRSVISEVVSQAGLARFLGGYRLVSDSGVLSALYRSPSCLFQIDEFGKFLSSVFDARNAGVHRRGIWDLLTELGTSAQRTMNGAEYADQQNRPRKDIVQPHCVIHATSTPETFWGALKSGSVLDGSLARWLVFVTDDPLPARNRKQRDITAVPEDLIEGAKAISIGAANWQLPNVGLGPNVDPAPHVICYDSGESEEYYSELWDHIDEKRRREHNGHSAIFARWNEMIVRLALCYAISEDSKNPKLSIPCGEWAKSIVDYCISVLLRESDQWVSENQDEDYANRVLRVIKQAGEAGITGHELANRTRFLSGNRRKRTDILADLAESGRITARQTPSNGAGRPGTHYLANFS